jgi:hypothetical protein
MWTAAAATTRSRAPAWLQVPVHRIMDARAHCTPQQLRHFWSSIWPEAVRTFSQGGIELQTSDGPGEVKLSPGSNPIFVGLRPAVINLVLTDHVPTNWDKGRALAGVTTLWNGFPVSMIAIPYAHGNQIPFVSVNTCVHELLHTLFQDIFVGGPKWYQSVNANSERIGMQPAFGYFTMEPPFENHPRSVSIACDHGGRAARSKIGA